MTEGSRARFARVHSGWFLQEKSKHLPNALLRCARLSHASSTEKNLSCFSMTVSFQCVVAGGAGSGMESSCGGLRMSTDTLQTRQQQNQGYDVAMIVEILWTLK